MAIATTAPASAAMKQGEAEILLESGTNELEVLVFGMGDGVFGVNVAKVREVILPVVASASPGQPDCVMGMFNLRGNVMALVDLPRYLNIKPSNSNPKNRRIIVTEFNGIRAAFLVERVEQIFRMSWSNMKPIPETDANNAFAVTGITEINNRLVLMLDFESILDHINMQEKLHVDQVENKWGVNRASHCVYLAEDSKFIRSLMVSLLSNCGYTQIQVFNDGAEAWRAMQAAQAGQGSKPDLLIADIEMPQMDGLALTKQVKESPELRQMPVILFSSLISSDTLHKGQQVGADDQIAKPQLPELVELVDRWAKKIEDARKAA